MSKAQNFVVFLTDDHGHWTLPCYGNREVDAPHLTELASGGMVFDAATCPSPVCSPARASFWTGRFPSAHGVHDWIPEEQDPGTFPHIDRMPGNLIERLKAVGYQTGGVGKYHCNHAEANPLGADYWFVQQTPIRYLNHCHQVWNDNGTQVEHEGYQASVMADAAIRFLQERETDRPFFLFIGLVNTHAPHTDEPEELVEKYRKASFCDIPRETYSETHGRLRFGMKEGDQWIDSNAHYYASVETIDEQVGRVMSALSELNLRDSTHVIYTSDHGHMNGHHGLHTKGNATVPVNFLEESIRVPLIWNGPGVDAGRNVTRVNHCDTYATLLDLAGSPLTRETSDGAVLPGVSYREAFSGETLPQRTRFCEYGNSRMIHAAGIKFIVRTPGPQGVFPDEAYDLDNDPRERTNIIDVPEYAERISVLRSRLEEWFATHELNGKEGTDVLQLAKMHDTSPWNMDPLTFPVLYQ